MSNFELRLLSCFKMAQKEASNSPALGPDLNLLNFQSTSKKQSRIDQWDAIPKGGNHSKAVSHAPLRTSVGDGTFSWPASFRRNRHFDGGLRGIDRGFPEPKAGN